MNRTVLTWLVWGPLSAVAVFGLPHCMEAKQAAVSAANAAVQIGVDTCKELDAPDSGASGLVQLACTGLVDNQAAVTVLVDAGIWLLMKKSYLAEHGHLPAGMSVVP